MGISKHLKNPSIRRRKDEITPNDVTEQSLQVWLALPSKIRRDPSLASFQMEHERLHGDLKPIRIYISPCELFYYFVLQVTMMNLLMRILMKLQLMIAMKINQNS